MTNLFETMMAAQNGGAARGLGRQFGLSEDQTEKVLEFMMPAFSKGLKQNTADPFALMNFMSALSSGRHARFYEEPGIAFREDAIHEGNAILGHLFGSKDASRAIADQVALASGVAPAVLKQMLPVIASMVMGGLFKNSIDNATRAANPMGNLLGSFMEAMMKGAIPAVEPPAPKPDPAPANPFENNPFAKMMEEFMGGTVQQKPAQPEPEIEPPRRGEDIFGDLFESGRQVQKQYQDNLDSILDTYLKGMRHS